jgi:hypothetical protein
MRVAKFIVDIRAFDRQVEYEELSLLDTPKHSVGDEARTHRVIYPPSI